MAYYAPFYRPNYYQQQMSMQGQHMQENQQQFVPQYQQQFPMMAQSNTDLIWVLGENEAASYLVAPGNTVTLWDKNNPTIYIKSVNAQGVPSLRILDFNERAQNAPQKASGGACECAGKYAPIETVNGLERKIEALESKLEEMSSVKPAKQTRKADEQNV